MKKLLLAAVALTAIPLLAIAAGPAGIDAQRLSDTVKTIASDEYEGRGPATPGEVKTVAYIIAQMKADGLQPGGDKQPDGTRAWTQDVPLGRFEITGTPSFSYAIGGATQALAQGDDIAVRASMTNVDRVDIENAPLVFLGYGVKAREKNWDDFKGMDLKGKVGIVLINDPDFETGSGDFGGKAMTYYGRWTYKYEEAARQGLAGLIIVHETAPASYGWATVKNSNTNVQFDIVRKKPLEAHPLMEAWIQRDQAAAMLQKAGLDYEALKKLAQTRDFKPVVLTGETFTAKYDVDHKVIVSKNVAGILPGTKHPDELLVYTAHWDHLGVGRPDAKGDKIYNGALDNASGIACLLELARVFGQGPKPERSILFLAVTAEEKGLLGSEYYAANPLYPLATTVGDINMDGAGINGRAHDFTISGSAKLALLDDLTALAATRGRTYSPDPRPEAGSFFRSDHFPFAKRGVPAISFGSGQNLLEGGVTRGKALADAYVKDRYHQPADEWSADWDWSGVVEDLTLLHDLGWKLANSREWPEWAAGSEFKAARDETKGQRK
ncbi:Zn-dependent M28 family amino/carboxypeptidase [Caulobacter ginsengisoli]|uniref:Zn-dependent M28 family amino/carboxypeptidase n=1 Tax=Caulobacter ginsengisoli TaxID=400775 RepID=A0ABU0IYF0_9CAUL|nr:M28 family metallopeptidase [Caulobacter ginsengisoli]MDQ0466380.1 Zn-dependent M28 family amino/carboxypeptidase [Caulobacter ginsengisoli]